MQPARPPGESDRRGEFHLSRIDSSRVERQLAAMAGIEPFERQATEYEEWFEKNQLAYFSELQAVKEQLPRSGDGLEIGVGTGRFAFQLGIRFGVEPSSCMREIARHRDIEVVGGVAENLPFANAQFDFVLSVTTVCFLDDIDAALHEAHRVLKHKGCIVIGFIDRESPLGGAYERNKEKSKFYRVATFHSADEIVSHLEQAGFGHFAFTQTILHHPNEIRTVEPAIAGHGQGLFVVLSASKRR